MIDLDAQQIQNLFDFETAAEAVQAAYIASAQGQVQAPPVTYLGFPEIDGDCHVKTGHIKGSEAFVIKVATGFYHNPAKGLPSSNGMNLLFSSQTGAPVAALRDDGWLTDMRTGLGGALATRALAVPEFTDVLIVGTGLQARHQARCLQQLIPERPLSFQIWGRDQQKATETATELRRDGLAATPVEALQAACSSAQVVITTTPSQTPLIQKAWISPGTQITAIGADCPGKQELDKELVSIADVRACDLPAQSLDHGEFQTLHAAGRLPERDVVTLGHILAGGHPGRLSRTDITIADLTGLAAQDAAISLAVFQAANRMNSQT